MRGVQFLTSLTVLAIATAVALFACTVETSAQGAGATDGLAAQAGSAGEAGAAPAAPTGLEAHVVDDALLIDLRWQDNAGDEESYVIERSLEGEDGPWVVLATLPADSADYFDSGLEDGVTYWYRVAVANAAGMSAYSKVASGTATALPTPPLGDISCDGAVNSLDAALVLQLDAGLLSSHPCMEFADANADGVANAIDAALILQYDAGLIPSVSATSGIEGQVLVGPQCPVMREDVSCPDLPLEASIDVWDADRSTIVTTFRSDEHGRFRVPLAPGEYYLDPQPVDPDSPFPVPEPRMVLVEPGSWTELTVRYDSGIR